MCIEMEMFYEAECENCGKTYTRGHTNMNNTLFIKELKKLGWRLETTKRKFNACSKKCERQYIKIIREERKIK